MAGPRARFTPPEGRHRLEDRPETPYRPNVPERPGRVVPHLAMHYRPESSHSVFDPPPGRTDRSRFFTWKADPERDRDR